MKTARVGLLTVAVALSTFVVSAYNKTVYPYEVPSGKQGVSIGATYATAGMQLEPGKWYTNFAVCKKFADDNGMPLLAVWGNHECVHCWYTESCFTKDAFKAWLKENNAGQVILCFMAGGMGKDFPDQMHSSAYNWMWKGGGRTLSQYPFVVMWWRKQNVNVRLTGEEFCAKISDPSDPNNPSKIRAIDTLSNTDATIPARIANMTARLEAAFAGWTPAGQYAGGLFTGTETEGNRLEAEAGTTNVTFTLVRGAEAAKVATNHLLTVTGPDGAVATNTVVWQAGEAEQALALNLADYPAFDADGETLTLAVLDAGGEVQDTRTVTFVARANGAENPLWIGERMAETLAFGEWTMDFEAATNKAARADGEAYTLVAVSGALWCPDCANTERNFLDVADAEGVNRFKAWAASNGVALVTVDVPNFQADGAFESPTFLSRRAFATTLARMREYPASGADAALTNAMLRSGLGYLTRKGVSDEAAAAALARNHALVRRGGLLHSPIDTDDNRTGVPIFVLLRKDGTVAARLTRFAATSPMASAREQWGDLIKRFDEMLAVAASAGGHADPAEFANDAPQGAVGFAANGGTAAGELSHADFRDVFRLDGVGGNALQKVTITGTTGARVTASFLALDADGKKVAVGTPVTGALTAEGFALEHTFTAAGTYYVEVAGADITDAAFAVESPAEMNFHPYALAGTVVLVPQETRATATAPTGSDQVVMRLEKGQKYRIQGLKVNAVGDALTPDDPSDPYGLFFTAQAGGDVSLTCQNKEGTVTYSRWNPGKVGFTAAARTVKENVGSVVVAVARTEAASGRVELKVSLDVEATTLYDSDGKARFAFEDAALVWEEGEKGEKTVTIAVLDDMRFDGTGVVALTLERVGGDGTPEVAGGAFALTVTDDDKQSAGKAAFTGAEPYFARAKTVYVREGEKATVRVGRVEASDGPVTVRVKASPATVALGGNIKDGILSWANHQAEERIVTVAGLAAGKTATLTLANATDGLRILSASNYVKVVAVAANAPAFEQDAAQAALVRYVAASNVYAVVDVPEGTTKLSFTKISGTLPAGLRAAWDPAANALAVSGATTAKAGAYAAVYQVSARVANRTVPGLTLALAFTVTDVALPGADGAAALNPALAKARTFRDLPVLDEVNTNLVGTLQVTVPPTGRVSAKWLCATGTVSFTARNWSEAEEDGTVRAKLVGSKKGYAMALEAAPDGSLTIELTDDRGKTAQVRTDGRLWSKADSAEGWRGQYTVSLRNAAREESVEGLAPRGHGYLTLKMTSATAWNAGRMTWAGLLPNGTAVSGSATLARGLRGSENEDVLAYLPVYLRSSRDVLAVLMQIGAGNAENDEPTIDCQAVFEASDLAEAYWSHADSAALRYTVEWDVYGGDYSSSYDLFDYFATYYTEASIPPNLAFNIKNGLGSGLSAGTPNEVDAVSVRIDKQTLAISKDGPNVCRATLSFNRSTGVVSGSFRLPVTKVDGTQTTVMASYRGVVLIGWGPGCGCTPADTEIVLPFVSGAYWVSDKFRDETTGRNVMVKRGGAAELADPKGE